MKNLTRARNQAEASALNAFTLVELITVIAIVLVLAALGAFSIGRGLETAKSAKCASNLKQLAAAVSSYANDNDGMVPPSVYSPSLVAPGGKIWAHWLIPYSPVPRAGALDNTNSPYFCPSARRPGDWANSAPDYTCNDRANVSATTGAFVQHAWLGAGASYPAQVRLAAIARPSKVFMFADSFYNSDVRQSGQWSVEAGRLATKNYFGQSTLPSQGIAPRHYFRSNPVRGQFNAVFFDGHVESFEWQDPRLQDSAFRQSLVDTL